MEPPRPSPAALDAGEPQPVAWALFGYIEGEGWVAQHPVRFTEAQCESDKSMYAKDALLAIRPLYDAPVAVPVEAREPMKHWCETCEGLGTIDETLGGESFSNPRATCPDCDGQGWWTPSRQDASPVAAAPQGDAPEGSWLWVQLMDWCKQRRVHPSDYNDLFAIAGRAHERAASTTLNEQGKRHPAQELSPGQQRALERQRRLVATLPQTREQYEALRGPLRKVDSDGERGAVSPSCAATDQQEMKHG